MIYVDLFTIDYRVEGAIYGFNLVEIGDLNLETKLTSRRALFGIKISGIENRLEINILFLKVTLS